MRILLSNASPDPIYEQILRQVRAQILSGDLKEGQALPSIRKLAQNLQISVITTKRAYDELEREGLIDTVAGKGTFVASPNLDFLQEKRIAAVEARLREAVREAEAAGLSAEDLKQMLDLLLEPDHA
ncbi:MAG: HTH-type transcriptional repressor YtrA [Acidobacteria bacterium ADurb.Bin340]|nr:MAG: HTH-type transcriptional repressor YtrA [Acidobacteria bacterium ADurb.Bin340]HOD32865.1 GntR family transcriptional regulator [Holophaga sp.]HQL48140.1 GntR family transcriptional regulator [Holophaga sp.]